MKKEKKVMFLIAGSLFLLLTIGFVSAGLGDWFKNLFGAENKVTGFAGGSSDPSWIDCMIADTNGDGIINLLDQGIVGDNWRKNCSEGKICGDLNNDGVVDLVDIGIIGDCSNKEVCVPKTCSQLGKQCGNWGDGCVGRVDCGGCLAGKSCINGICVEGNTTQTCSDSDGGLNYYIKGTGKLIKEHEDYCSPDYLYEHFCNGIITKDDYFYVEINGEEQEIRYKGADKVTATAPTVKFDITGVNNTMEVNLNRDGTFNLKLSGQTLHFKNASSANSNDFDIVFLDGAYLVKEDRYRGCVDGCNNGACIGNATQPTCTDSDGGLNYYVKGVVTMGDSSYTDTCIGNELREYYCENNTSKLSIYTCPNGCSNGACISGNVSNASCTDSDGGIVPDIYGEVYSAIGSFERTISDSCADVGYSKLIIVNDSGQYWQQVSECINPVEQNNASVGDCSITSYNEMNNCSDNNCYVNERYCGYMGGGYDGEAHKFIKCPDGCSNGACIGNATQPTCTDSDGGLNYYVKGFSEGYYNGVFANSSDVCSGDGGNLKELYCDEQGNLNANYYYCPVSCINGACFQNSSNSTFVVRINNGETINWLGHEISVVVYDMDTATIIFDGESGVYNPGDSTKFGNVTMTVKKITYQNFVGGLKFVELELKEKGRGFLDWLRGLFGF